MSRLSVLRIAPLVLVLTLVAGCDYVERASVDNSGGNPFAASFDPSISGNGRYAVFWSGADDLVPGDDNGVNDVFRRDLLTNTTIRVSVDTEGDDPNSESFYPSISGDGRYVAFASSATDLVEGDGNAVEDIFRARRAERGPPRERRSIAPAGRPTTTLGTRGSAPTVATSSIRPRRTTS